MVTDTEILNWLDENMKGYGDGWICRNSSVGCGLQLYEITYEAAVDLVVAAPRPTVREAIMDAMSRGV